MKIIINDTPVTIENFHQLLKVIRQFPDHRDALIAESLHDATTLQELIASLSNLRAAKDYPDIMLPFIDGLFSADQPLAYFFLMATTKKLPAKTEKVFQKELKQVDFLKDPLPGFATFQAIIKEFPKQARTCFEIVIKKNDINCFRWLTQDTQKEIFYWSLDEFIQLLKLFTDKSDKTLLLNALFEKPELYQNLFTCHEDFHQLMREFPELKQHIIQFLFASHEICKSRNNASDLDHFKKMLSFFLTEEQTEIFRFLFSNKTLYQHLFSSCWYFFETMDAFPEHKENFIQFLLSDFEAFQHFTESGDEEETVIATFFKEQKHLHLINILINLKQEIQSISHTELHFGEQAARKQLKEFSIQIQENQMKLTPTELNYLIKIIKKEFEKAASLTLKEALRDRIYHLEGKQPFKLFESSLFAVRKNKNLFSMNNKNKNFNLSSLCHELQEAVDPPRKPLNLQR